LHTTEKSGAVFIRTDQLDGETDWKLRKAVSCTQKVDRPSRLTQVDGKIVANPPNNLIYDFQGFFESKDLATNASVIGRVPDPGFVAREGLSLENTMWANTVLASSGHVLAMVVYTGLETRANMNQR